MHSPPVDPENPQGLRGAPITISGTVHTTSTCTVLDTGSARWLLTGPLVATLHDGSAVTVQGRPAALPPGCPAQHVLEVRKVF